MRTLKLRIDLGQRVDDPLRFTPSAQVYPNGPFCRRDAPLDRPLLHKVGPDRVPHLLDLFAYSRMEINDFGFEAPERILSSPRLARRETAPGLFDQRLGGRCDLFLPKIDGDIDARELHDRAFRRRGGGFVCQDDGGPVYQIEQAVDRQAGHSAAEVRPLVKITQLPEGIRGIIIEVDLAQESPDLLPMLKVIAQEGRGVPIQAGPKVIGELAGIDSVLCASPAGQKGDLEELVYGRAQEFFSGMARRQIGDRPCRAKIGILQEPVQTMYAAGRYMAQIIDAMWAMGQGREIAHIKAVVAGQDREVSEPALGRGQEFI